MEERMVNQIRALSLDMINEAKSGHPGICMGAAPIMYTLFLKHLNVMPENPTWLNRDRFIMSAGHGSALLYSTLFLSGFPIEESELKKFRSIDGLLHGHPELNPNIGIECTTGPLGEGFATAVGMAIGEEYLNKSVSSLINHYTFVLVGDGDLMEGISYEAASLAGSLKLGKLIVLYDSNNISLDGSVKGVFNDNVLERFESCGWHTSIVSNAEDLNEIDKAISDAKKVTNKPSLIEIKSIIGYGSLNAGKNTVHGKPLTEEDIIQFKQSFDVDPIPFKIPKESTIKFRDDIRKRVWPLYNEWENEYKKIINVESKERNNLLLLEKGFKLNLNNLELNLEEDELRNINNKVISLIGNSTKLFIGGSADVASSTKTIINDGKDFKINEEYGSNIHFGVRENVMASINNGLTLMGLKSFVSCFLTFSDFMKPGLRLSALMNIPSIFVFTHDNISIGEDGPTHEPIEHIGALRSIPNMTVFRPCDEKEIIGSWNYALNSKSPTSIIVSKDKLPKLETSNSELTNKGAYIVYKENNNMDAIIIATGSEVSTAIEIAKELETEKIYLRVVSMPSMEVFERQNQEYKDSIIEPMKKVITLESSNDSNWYKYASNKNGVIGVNNFGYSGKRDDILKKMSFDKVSLKERILKSL